MVLLSIKSPVFGRRVRMSYVVTSPSTRLTYRPGSSLSWLMEKLVMRVTS